MAPQWESHWYYTRDGERAPAAWDERESAASLIKAISWKIPGGFTGRNHDHCAAGGEHEGSCPSDQQGQTCSPPFSPRVFLRCAVSFIFTGRKQKSPGSRARRNQFLTGNVMQGCSLIANIWPRWLRGKFVPRKIGHTFWVFASFAESRNKIMQAAKLKFRAATLLWVLMRCSCAAEAQNH